MKPMKALTLQVGIFGRVNVGKSSLINLITDQNTSIVSHIAGTTTDIVYKQMELNPLGPVTFIDTAGIDDNSNLGKQRAEKTANALEASDIILLVVESDIFGEYEENIIMQAKQTLTPVILVINKTDLKQASLKYLNKLKKISPSILEITSTDFTQRDSFLNNLKKTLLEVLPENFIENFSVIKQILKDKDTAILVVPIDLGAPKGRLIMPQVQIIRSILDINACAYIVKNTEYEEALKNLKNKLQIVITDSQVLKEVSALTPKDIKLTTFSTLFSAEKADIVEMAKGASKIKSLKDGDKVLIAEACTHHSSADDIGKVKIPKWLKEYVKKDIQIDFSQGQAFPANLRDYSLIIHCGACTLNRKAMLSRLNKAVEAGVPITNYGIAISVFQGFIEKVLEIFPDALNAYKKS